MASAEKPQAAPTAQQRNAIGQAEQLSEAFSYVAEQASPAVVSISVETRSANPRSFFFGGAPSQPTKGGSGFIFRTDGAILTNNHVVEKASRVDVVLQDGRAFQAKVVGADPATDLAVLKIDAQNLPSLSFADSEQARVGQWVVAIGSPFGLDYTLTVGVVSALGRGLGATEIEDYLQTDASINPGNSGGPLINLDGNVLGINTIIVGPTNAGIGFAIPSSLAHRVADQLLEHGKVERAWIGISFQELTPELASGFGTTVRGGALVASVAEDGPAGRAGVKAGDIIEQVDGVKVKSGHELLHEVLKKRVGQQVSLQLLRNKKKQTLSIKTGKRPTDANEVSSAWRNPQAPEQAATKGLGVTLRYLSPEEAQRMGKGNAGLVIVQHIEPGGIADRSDLKVGDIILKADEQPVHGPETLNKALADGEVLLQVERRGATRFVALRRGGK